MKTKMMVYMISAGLVMLAIAGSPCAVFCADPGSQDTKAPVEGTKVVISDGVVRIVPGKAADTAEALPSTPAEVSGTTAISPIDDNIDIERADGDLTVETGSAKITPIDEYLSIEEQTKGAIEISISRQLVEPPAEKANDRPTEPDSTEPAIEPNQKAIRTESDAGRGRAAIMPAPGFGPMSLKAAGTASPVMIHSVIRSDYIVDGRMPMMLQDGIGTSLVTRGPPPAGFAKLNFERNFPNETFDHRSFEIGDPYSQRGIFCFYEAEGLAAAIVRDASRRDVSLLGGLIK
jgi:hypothetical protein